MHSRPCVLAADMTAAEANTVLKLSMLSAIVLVAPVVAAAQLAPVTNTLRSVHANVTRASTVRDRSPTAPRA